MKGTMKIVAMVLVVFMVLAVASPVFAWDPGKLLNTVESQAATVSTTDNSVAKVAAEIIAFIRNLAIVVGIVMVSVLGIKYMVGSAEEKASYKKTLIPLVVGIILVVAASTLVSIVFNFANGF